MKTFICICVELAAVVTASDPFDGMVIFIEHEAPKEFVKNRQIVGTCSVMPQDAVLESPVFPIELQLDLLSTIVKILVVNPGVNWRDAYELRGVIYGSDEHLEGPGLWRIPTYLLDKFIAHLVSWVELPAMAHTFLVWINQLDGTQEMSPDLIWWLYTSKARRPTRLSCDHLLEWCNVAILPEVGNPVSALPVEFNDGMFRLQQNIVPKMLDRLHRLIERNAVPAVHTPVRISETITGKPILEPAPYHMREIRPNVRLQLMDILEVFLEHFALLSQCTYRDLCLLYEREYVGHVDAVAFGFVVEWIEKVRSVPRTLHEYLVFYNHLNVQPATSASSLVAWHRQNHPESIIDEQMLSAWYVNIILPGAANILPGDVSVEVRNNRMFMDPGVLKHVLQNEFKDLAAMVPGTYESRSVMFCVICPTVMDPLSLVQPDPNYDRPHLMNTLQLLKTWDGSRFGTQASAVPLCVLRKLHVTDTLLTLMVDAHKRRNSSGQPVCVDGPLINSWLDETRNTLDQSVSDIANLYRVLFAAREPGSMFCAERDLWEGPEKTFQPRAQFLDPLIRIETERFSRMLEKHTP